MEFALHIGRLSENLVEKHLDKYSRLYFGDDFCEHLLPNEKEFERKLLFASKHKKNLTLVTSPMGQKSLESLSKLIDKYHKYVYDFNFEIVFNDYGVYQSLNSYTSFKLVCGRVLSRFKRDPRQYELKEQLDSSFFQTNTSGDYIQKMFSQKKITRIDMDWNQYINVPFNNKGINYSVITPWTYLTTTRLCRLNESNLYDEDNRLRVNSNCTHMCKNVKIIMKTPSIPRDLIAIGNTQFYHVDSHPPETEGNFYNRIVEQEVDIYER